MKLYVLDNGTEMLDKSFFIAGANSAVNSNKNPTNEWITIPIHAFLIEHEDGYILFDTGCDPEWKKNWPAFIPEQSPYFATDDQMIISRLKQLGLDADDIKHVVISHLHVDHAGNLYRFKKAQVFVNEMEFTSTLKGYVTGTDLDVHVPSDIEHFIDAKLNWRLVPNEEKELEIVKGVTLLNFGSGHSFGMMGMKVELKNSGNFLIVADAIYCEENIKPEIKVPGILYDSLGYKKTVKYILDYAKKSNAKILYGHDIKQYNTLIKSTEGYYD